MFALVNVTLIGLILLVGRQPGIDLQMVLLVGAVSAVVANGATWFGVTRVAKMGKNGRALFCFLAGVAAAALGIAELLTHDTSGAGQSFFLGVLLIAGGMLVRRSRPEKEGS